MHSPCFAAVDRYVNGTARFLWPIIGLGFWLALLAVALAASMGWRLAQ